MSCRARFEKRRISTRTIAKSILEKETPCKAAMNENAWSSYLDGDFDIIVSMAKNDSIFSPPHDARKTAASCTHDMST